MNISTIGTSNIQALNLISLLGSSSTSSSSEDLLSLLGSQTDSVSLSSQGQWLSRTQDTNPFKADFEDLGSLISSGDVEGAKEAFATMIEKMQAHQGAGDDPMASDFAAIGNALESGDTEAAQEAWSALEEKLQSMPPPPPPPREDDETSSSTSSVGSSTSTTPLEALLASTYLQSGYFTNTTTNS